MKTCRECGAAFEPEAVTLDIFTTTPTDLCRVCRALASRIPDSYLTRLFTCQQKQEETPLIW